MAASLILYIGLLIKKRSDSITDEIKIDQLEKIAQYFSAAEDMEKAIRQLVTEQPGSSQDYARIVKKMDDGIELEAAVFQAMDETSDEFFSKICLLLVSVLRKNDPELLYETVQKMKEALNSGAAIQKKAEVNSWIIQVVFCLIMPLIFFFMIGILGFEADIYLNGFLGFIVISAALFQGVVFRQWAETAAKAPMLFSAFYVLYFTFAPKFFSGLIGPLM